MASPRGTPDAAAWSAWHRLAAMEETPSGWHVIDRERGVLMRSYKFNKGGQATTFVARMGDGKLVVVSPATGLDEAAYAELAPFGDVGALVANNGFHHLGQAAWRARFPQARAFAPAVAQQRIARKSKTPLAFESMAALAELTGPDVGFRDVPDTKAGESWCWARTAGGHAWYASDVLINLPKPPPFPIGLLFKWTGSAPGYRVFGLAMKLILKDKAAALRLLAADVEAHPPTTMVPGHGDVLAPATLAADTRALVAAR